MPDNTSDAQLDFLKQVLQATANSRGNKQVIYRLLAANTDKLNQKLAELLRVWATSKLAEAETDEAKSLAADIGTFSNLIQQFPLGDKASNIEIAIACYQSALEIRTRETFPEKWAMTQHNLGLAYCNRIKGEKAQNLENAIACYQSALEVRTRETFPEKWAMTQHNLGNAYSDRITGPKAQNLEQAIACYQSAKEVYTRETFPEKWAMTQNNLGIAYYDRIRGEKAQNLEDAIACYQLALAIRTREAFPYEWAQTQNNLGNAYYDRITGPKAQNLEEAIACFQSALAVRTREAFPEEWAMTQNNLGNAYRERITGQKAQNIEDAIPCFQSALAVYTRETFPETWAWTKNNLGLAYYQRIKGQKAQNIEDAIPCFQSALEVHTHEAFPKEWAGTKNNLGLAYSDRIIGEKAQNVEQAIACFQEALTVRTFDAFPQNHAETLFNLGLTYKGSNQFTLAYTKFKFAIDTVESLREEIVSGEESKRKQAEEWNKLYRSMVEVCLELNNITEAIEYVERSKTRNLVEEILSRDLKTIFTTDVVTELETYRDEIAAGQYQIQHGKAENQKVLAQHLQQLRQQRNDLQDQYLPIGSTFQFKQFQQKLDDRTTIAEFYITGNKLLCFLFNRHIVWHSKLEDLEESIPLWQIYFLRWAVESGSYSLMRYVCEKLGSSHFDKFLNWENGYWQAYNNEKYDWQNDLSNRLHLLAEILHIDDIIQQIAPECDRLILIPHQVLHLFPLHALPINSQQGEATSQILMDRFPAGVSYAPSCQLLQLAQTRKRPNFTHLFAVQNPTGDLSYANIGVEVIKSYFNPADTEVLVENAATKAAIDSKPLNTYHCVHFSCHGYFNLNQPQKSALILADAYLNSAPAELNPEQHLVLDDGEVIDLHKCLTLDAIFALKSQQKLAQCRLVTLSACETGLIDFDNTSDEYIGLPSGFLVAGSPAVVSSLWKVEEVSTALLMIKFYQNLLNQMSLAVALNQAQLWLRDATVQDLRNWAEQLTKQLTLENNFKEEVEEEIELFKNDYKPFYSPYYWAAYCAIGESYI
ncbi:CHAT domain-containing tetratricopeptide repeat protein [Moorena sp. SIO1G6]|uniref:CHAT domain-containing tetratricopeptide repeat protein n=1 Tax=Moorena sp. SIO1G6 TaxID=2607840 RepID=UPI00257A51EE|nr:CHAT domain-containing tetratricopeptide repeat protein [Moorena sp. SIO1G6]